MIVIREGNIPDSRELEDYLYNSEVSRSDFIDFTPIATHHANHDGMSIHVSDWDIVFKGDEKYDSWHLIADIEMQYAFDDPRYRAMLLLEKYRKLCKLQVVNHDHAYVYLIYQVPKELSEKLGELITAIIESFNGKEYTVELHEDVLGPIGLSLEEGEMSQGT